MTRRVIDTSALMEDCCAVVPQAGEEVIVPIGVVHELDYLKEDPRRRARAMSAIRSVLEHSSNDAVEISDLWAESDTDTQVVEIARAYKGASISSNDLGIHLRAAQAGIECHACTPVFPDVTEVYIDSEKVDQLYKTGRCETIGIFAPNQCLLLRNLMNPSQTILGLASRDKRYIYRVHQRKPWDVAPKTMRQHFLAQVLSDPEIKLATVVGPAGTGKTYLTCAAALEQVFDQMHYKNICVTRPFVSAGNDLGYLPGGMEEKMAPWMGATDILFKELIDSPGSGHIFDGIKCVPLSFARGMTIINSFWILDECQNFNLDELKTLLTRAGEGTKVVLTGDLSQSDLRSGCTGMQRVIDAFYGERFYAHVTLDKTQRGDICRVACERL